MIQRVVYFSSLLFFNANKGSECICVSGWTRPLLQLVSHPKCIPSPQGVSPGAKGNLFLNPVSEVLLVAVCGQDKTGRSFSDETFAVQLFHRVTFWRQLSVDLASLPMMSFCAHDVTTLWSYLRVCFWLREGRIPQNLQLVSVNSDDGGVEGREHNVLDPVHVEVSKDRRGHHPLVGVSVQHFGLQQKTWILTNVWFRLFLSCDLHHSENLTLSFGFDFCFVSTCEHFGGGVFLCPSFLPFLWQKINFNSYQLLLVYMYLLFLRTNYAQTKHEKTERKHWPWK